MLCNPGKNTLTNVLEGGSGGWPVWGGADRVVVVVVAVAVGVVVWQNQTYIAMG